MALDFSDQGGPPLLGCQGGRSGRNVRKGMFGELGPLDVQIPDPEREEWISGLDEVQALERLHAFFPLAKRREASGHSCRGHISSSPRN